MADEEAFAPWTEEEEQEESVALSTEPHLVQPVGLKIAPRYDVEGIKPRPAVRICLKRARNAQRGYAKRWYLLDTGADRTSVTEADHALIKARADGHVRVVNAAGRAQRALVRVHLSSPGDGAEAAAWAVELTSSVRGGSISHGVLGMDWVNCVGMHNIDFDANFPVGGGGRSVAGGEPAAGRSDNISFKDVDGNEISLTRLGATELRFEKIDKMLNMDVEASAEGMLRFTNRNERAKRKVEEMTPKPPETSASVMTSLVAMLRKPEESNFSLEFTDMDGEAVTLEYKRANDTLRYQGTQKMIRASWVMDAESNQLVLTNANAKAKRKSSRVTAHKDDADRLAEWLRGERVVVGL